MRHGLTPTIEDVNAESQVGVRRDIAASFSFDRRHELVLASGPVGDNSVDLCGDGLFDLSVERPCEFSLIGEGISVVSCFWLGSVAVDEFLNDACFFAFLCTDGDAAIAQ
ncbi:hypothetical protein PF003_g20550 [Phytophthora fragariae]|nr:hypothetical protein PF003_g20550 [Phytophthora fragariae]